MPCDSFDESGSVANGFLQHLIYCIILLHSGNLYHSGEHSTTLNSYSKGDVITCVLNATERTLSFGLNSDAVDVAFRDVDTSKELHPCVMFYSSSTGEQVKISDFQVC